MTETIRIYPDAYPISNESDQKKHIGQQEYYYSRAAHFYSSGTGNVERVEGYSRTGKMLVS